MANASDLRPPSSAFRPLFLAGPTAVGKSEIALLLAEKIGGEIISVDSMQVYRGLDIGTAKPSAEERARVPHHLIDVVDLTEPAWDRQRLAGPPDRGIHPASPFDAAQFVRRANEAVVEIQSRRRVPIFCGGTGLYFKAFLEGLGDTPPADEKLRAELEVTPLPELLAELAEKDPATHEKIDRQNPRRVIRAIEVIRLTGKKFSEQRAEWKNLGPPASRRQVDASEPCGETPTAPGSAHIIAFSRANTDLHARINSRVDTMFTRGLVEETRQLLERGLAQNKTALQALGYRQVVEHLRGERGLPETIELVKIKTRQFAKRQMTWFRRHGNCEWIELKPGNSYHKLLDCLAVKKCQD
jgi:tRNA dimethylallyltransferase